MFAISYVGLFSVLLEGGIDIVTMREIAAGSTKAQVFFAHTSFTKFISSVIVGLIITASILIFDLPASAKLLILIALVYNLANTAMLHFRYFFRAMEMMQYEAVSMIIEKFFVLVFCGFTLCVASGVKLFMISYSVAYSLSAVLTLVMLTRRIGFPRWTIDWHYLRLRILKPALPFALMGILMVVYFRSGTIMIRALTGKEEWVGYYNAGYRLIEGFVLFPSIIVVPLYAAFSRHRDNPALVKPKVIHAARVILFVSGMVATPIFIFREQFTRLLFGGEYLLAADTVGTMVFAMVPIGMTWIFGSLVGAIGRQVRLNVLIAIISASNILANYMLIPRFGLQGAVFTTVITEAAIAFSCWWILRDYFNEPDFWMLLLKILLPICGALVLHRFGYFHGSFAIQLPLLLLGLIGIYSSLRVVGMADLRRIFAR